MLLTVKPTPSIILIPCLAICNHRQHSSTCQLWTLSSRIKDCLFKAEALLQEVESTLHIHSDKTIGLLMIWSIPLLALWTLICLEFHLLVLIFVDSLVLYNLRMRASFVEDGFSYPRFIHSPELMETTLLMEPYWNPTALKALIRLWQRLQL